jgi:hypothetical protein
MSNYDSNPIYVQATQAAINAAGYQPQLKVDGLYGPKTQAGVVWFQGLHGLAQDGIIGDQTFAATIAPVPAVVQAALAASAAPAAAAIQQAIATAAPALVPPVTAIVAATPVAVSPVAAVQLAQAAATKVQAATTAMAATAQSTAMKAAAAAALPKIAKSKIPDWAIPLGLAALGGVGAAFAPFLHFALPLKIAIGAAVGGAAGAGASALMKPAAKPLPGKATFGIDAGLPSPYSGIQTSSEADGLYAPDVGESWDPFNYDIEEGIIGADGLPAPHSTMRG